MTGSSRKWWVATAIAAAFAIACVIVAAYSGGGGVWATKKGDFVSLNFAGDQSGLNSADAYISPTGVGQVGPGLEGLTMPSYRPGVGWVRQAFSGWEYRGLPWISMHRNLATARFDSAGGWFNVTGTGGRLSVYGSSGRWKFGTNGADLTDSSTTMTVKNENASGTMVIGGGNAASITMTNASTSFAAGRNAVFLQNMYTVNVGAVTTPSGTLNLQVGGALYNDYVLTGVATVDSVATNFPDGMFITIRTSDGLTIKDGKNLNLNGDFVGDASGGQDMILFKTANGVLNEIHRSWN